MFLKSWVNTGWAIRSYYQKFVMYFKKIQSSFTPNQGLSLCFLFQNLKKSADLTKKHYTLETLLVSLLLTIRPNELMFSTHSMNIQLITTSILRSHVLLLSSKSVHISCACYRIQLYVSNLNYRIQLNFV